MHGITPQTTGTPLCHPWSKTLSLIEPIPNPVITSAIQPTISAVVPSILQNYLFLTLRRLIIKVNIKFRSIDLFFSVNKNILWKNIDWYRRFLSIWVYVESSGQYRRFFTTQRGYNFLDAPAFRESESMPIS